jgi:histidinol-phosphate/aromatic aminotransferase/cobyric acid decarboxylase-like protein
MSKVYGLAGLRVGYAIGPANLILEIEKSRGPYKVGGVAELAASRAIRENQAWRRDVVKKTLENRTRLAGEIEARGLKQLTSAANFILILLPAGRDAVAVNNELRKYGVSTRPFSGLPALGECLRVTIGPWQMMEKFLNALESVIGK